MLILVIGCKGFIGSHVYNYFKKNHCPVLGCDIVLDESDDTYFQIGTPLFSYQDLFEKKDISVCINCSGSSSVLNSFSNPLIDFELNTYNVIKILTVINEFRPSCRYINLSSAAVYGNPKTFPISETNQLIPLSPYGTHKLQSEQICKEFFDWFNLKTCSLRIFSAYGPGLKKQLFWDLFQKYSSSETDIVLNGTGNETRDFIHVEDIVQSILCVLENANFNGESINIANGQSFTIKELADIFVSQTENKKNILFNNHNEIGYPLNWEADISLLKHIGYKQSVFIEDGIKNYIEWAQTVG